MRTYALLNNKVVVVDPTESQLEELIFMEGYDTVATSSTQFFIGDDFVNESNNGVDHQPIMSKFQAFYSMASFGLLDRIDKAVHSSGDIWTIELWRNDTYKLEGPWANRSCKMISDMAKLLNSSEEVVDAIFLRGVNLDVYNPKESLSELEVRLFDHEMIIWDRKNRLNATDYIEMQSYDKVKEDMITQRQFWRNEIRAARIEIAKLVQQLSSN